MGLEAAPALRLCVPSQQRACPLPILAASRREDCKRKFVCCANPHHQQQSNEEARLRAEISPSVLRALQPQDAKSSPNNPGESLIERNLRKRAAAKQASSAEQRSSALVPGDGVSSSPEELEFPASSILQHAPTSLSAESGFFPGNGESKDSSKHAMPNPCPISTAFWQEKPPGFSMENFHDLDFFASHFRLALLLHITWAEDLDYMESFPASSLFWLLLPSNGFPNSFFSGNGENLLLDWRKDVAENLGKITENEKILSGATEIFSTFWSPKSWTNRVTSGKAMELVVVLAYSAYVYILSGAAENAPNLKKKLEECSASLNRAVTQLHGSILDPVGVWEKALKATSFVLDGSAYVYDHALIFPCKLPASGGQSEFGSVLEEVQESLDKEYKGLDLVALLHRSSDEQEKFFLLIAPWYWVLTLESRQLAPVAGILAMLSCLATCNFASAGLEFGVAWEQYGAPLGWAGILAAMFFINDRQIPLLCPFPSLGAIGKFSSNLGILPSRKSFVRAVLKTSCVPLAVSLLLLACGWTFWGPLQYSAASVVDFGGYILVPSDIFAYSSVFTKVLQSVSVATIQAEDGGSKLAARPFALAGLLGLNFTAFSLFPGLNADGGNVLRSLFRSKKLANEVVSVCTVMLTLSLCVQNPFLGLGWLAMSFMSEKDSFVKDDVSDPDLLTSLAGSMLVAGALACFIPFPQL